MTDVLIRSLAIQRDDRGVCARGKASQVLWLPPEIPATQEAEMGKITVQGQPVQKVQETPMSTNKLGVMAGTVILPIWAV
jgi:hypothetical protein